MPLNPIGAGCSSGRTGWILIFSKDTQTIPFDVVCETLNVMSLNYAMQTWCAQQIQAAQMGILPQNYNLFGRLGQETGNGYYFDIFMWKPGDYSSPAPMPPTRIGLPGTRAC